jgi:hypothetical protein
MKRMLILLAIFMMVALVSCGEKKAEEPAAVETESPRIRVYHVEPVELPAWFYDDETSIKHEDGQRFIFFKISREAPTSRNAVNAVRTEVVNLVANAIGGIVSTEMVKATEGMLNDPVEMDEYFSETIAAISRNVDTGGIIPAGQIVEHLAIEEPGKSTVEIFRCTARYKMPYELFLDRLYKSMERNASRINQVLKGQGNEVTQAMKDSLYGIGMEQ